MLVHGRPLDVNVPAALETQHLAEGKRPVARAAASRTALEATSGSQPSSVVPSTAPPRALSARTSNSMIEVIEIDSEQPSFWFAVTSGSHWSFTVVARPALFTSASARLAAPARLGPRPKEQSSCTYYTTDRDL